MILTLKDKLDQGGWYDTPEVERVIEVITSQGASQGKLSAALQPVAQRLVKRFAEAKEALRSAKKGEQDQASAEAKDRIDALTLMKSDMQQYMRLYSYLSKMVD